MAAATNDRNTLEVVPGFRELPAAAAKKFFAGALVCADASGRATPGAVATTLRGIGRCERQVDNLAGAAGAVTVRVKTGTFLFANSSSGDAITNADIGLDCYVVDDQTVAKTSGSSTRSVAGKVYLVDALGVWVTFA